MKNARIFCSIELNRLSTLNRSRFLLKKNEKKKKKEITKVFEYKYVHRALTYHHQYIQTVNKTKTLILVLQKSSMRKSLNKRRKQKLKRSKQNDLIYNVLLLFIG